MWNKCPYLGKQRWLQQCISSRLERVFFFFKEASLEQFSGQGSSIWIELWIYNGWDNKFQTPQTLIYPRCPVFFFSCCYQLKTWFAPQLVRQGCSWEKGSNSLKDWLIIVNLNEVKKKQHVQTWMDFGIWLTFRYVPACWCSRIKLM